MSQSWPTITTTSAPPVSPAGDGDLVGAEVGGGRQRLDHAVAGPAHLGHRVVAAIGVLGRTGGHEPVGDEVVQDLVAAAGDAGAVEHLRRARRGRDRLGQTRQRRRTSGAERGSLRRRAAAARRPAHSPFITPTTGTVTISMLCGSRSRNALIKPLMSESCRFWSFCSEPEMLSSSANAVAGLLAPGRATPAPRLRMKYCCRWIRLRSLRRVLAPRASWPGRTTRSGGPGRR